MGIEDVRQVFRSLVEGSVASVQRKAVQWINAITLSAQHAELELARNEYWLGHYYESEQLLQKLLTTLEPIVSRHEEMEGNVPRAQVIVLYASAKTLLGQIHDGLGRNDRAREAFKEAVELFDRWMPEIMPTDRNHIDYGVALHLVGGREAEATAELEKATAMGQTAAEAYRYLGMRYQGEGDHEKAAKLLIKAVELAPEDVLARKALAVTFESLGRRVDAIRAYQEATITLTADNRLEEAQLMVNEALRLNHKDPLSLGLKAELLRMAGQYEEALDSLDQALEMRPEAPEYYLEAKARILFLLGDYGEALQILDLVLEQIPNELFALKYKSETLRQLGRNEEALEVLEWILELSSNDAWAWGTKGQVLRAQNRNQEAVESLEHALRLDPSLDWALAELGEALRLLGRNEEALQALDKALELSPNEPVYLRIRGQILHELHRYEEALLTLDQALELNSEDASTLMYKCDTLRSLGRYEEALEALNQVHELDIDDSWTQDVREQVLRAQNSEAMYREGEAHRRSGDNEEALQALEKALDLNPDNAWAWGTKGQVLRAQNRNQEAVESLEHALRLDPSLDWALAELGEALRLLGRNEEALQALDKALELSPEYAWAMATKGEVLRMLGNYEEALLTLDQALELSEDSGNRSWILGIKGATFATLDRFEEALQSLNYALQLLDEDLTPLQCAWVLTVKGEVLCSIASYEEAISVLQHAIELEDTDALAHGLTGWAHENLKENEKALKAYKRASKLERQNLWWHRGVADALLLVDKQKASEIHEWIIEETKRQTEEADVETLALLGWCHYRRERWDEALRHFGKALSLKADLIYAQFDLALVVMCSGRHALGLENYEQGVDLAEKKDSFVRRGLLHVAQRELSEAMQVYPEMAAIDDVTGAHGLLTKAYTEADKEVTQKLMDQPQL